MVALIAAVWTWWACKDGAYFGSVMYPGILLLCGTVLLIIASRMPLTVRLGLAKPVAAALAGLLGLGAWSALSALWSPAPDIAVADAQRIFGYGVSFGLGVWLCAILGRRMHLAMAPLAVAGLIAGGFAVAGMLLGEDPGSLLRKGTLEYPLGYRNANAAFFLIAVWPAIALAATRELDWRLRALALGTATLCTELAMLSQSRGSLIAAAVAVAVYLVVSPSRARSLLWLLLTVAPALVVLPSLTDLFQGAGDSAPAETIDDLRSAGRAVLLGALLATAAGAAGALAGRRFPAEPRLLARADRAVTVAVISLALAGVAGFIVATGDPIEWVGDKVREFKTEGTPDLSSSSSRFVADAGSERYDLWRVALHDVGAEPLLGDGGGGFHYSYLRQRGEGGVESVRDAHSIELEIASELGIPGLALFCVAIIGGAVGAVRSRRLGPSAAALSACALTAGSYWLAHASIEWLWTYPAVTAPVLALLGSACAPTVLAPRTGRGMAGRRLAAAGAIVLALSVIPPFLSERYLNQGFSTWQVEPEQADADLRRARALNPLSVEPLMAEGAIARARGQRQEAIDGFEEAARARPEEWAAHYFLATLYRTSSPARARSELDAAAKLNPRSTSIAALEERLAEPLSRGPGGLR